MKTFNENQQKSVNVLSMHIQSKLFIDQPNYIEIVKQDPFTNSLLVKMAFKDHEATVWVGVRGAIRTIDGKTILRADRHLSRKGVRVSEFIKEIH